MIHAGVSYGGIYLNSNSGGALQNADSTPAGYVFVNGADTSVSVTITQLLTGVYSVTLTWPTPLVIDDCVQCVIFETTDSLNRAHIVESAIIGALTDGEVSVAVFDPDVMNAIILVGTLLQSMLNHGVGDTEVSLTIENTTGEVVPGALVWLTTDEAGGIPVDNSRQYSTSLGIATWWLSSGTYYIWASKAGVTFDNPQERTVP